MAITRREFLKIAAAAGAAAASIPGLEYLGRRLSYASPQEIADILKHAGIKAKVYDASGNRTLFAIGDFHLGFGKTYVDFFENLEKKISTDKIFMKGVYDSRREQDPHIEYMTDAARLEGITFSPEEFRKEDSQGYFRLSEHFDIRGIEDRELSQDSAILHQLYRGIMSFYMSRDPWTADRIRELYEQLETKNFELGSLSKDMPRDQIKLLMDTIEEAQWRTAVCERNNHFVDVIDNDLRPYEVGALVVGESHCDASKQDLPENTSPDIIIPALKKRGINVVYIDVGQAVDYNKTQEGK